MAKVCICNTLGTLTTFFMVFLLYSFTSTFVCTLSSGFLLLLSFLLAISVKRHVHCLWLGVIWSCFAVALAIAFGTIATGLQYGYTTTKCYFNECCDNNWVSPNITGLSLQLNKQLHGQHLAITPMVKHLRGHVEGHPQKATVLSLHGLPGTGKNFLSRMVAENLYVKGMNSKYVHILSAAKSFPHENMLEEYKVGLFLQLNKQLHGQHLAITPIVKHLRGHVEGHPQKATVLSLLGLPGTGKNLLSRMVAENLYVKGMNSKYVHILSAANDFPHENMLEEFKEQLKLQIETAGKECSRSLFIIDEMDKLLPCLIDIIRPYIDYYDHVDGTDYRQFLFFFLSNTGGDAIAENVLSSNEQGRERRSLNLKEIQEVVRLSLLNGTNGLMHSSIVKNSLITAYIPFLPLERKHVEKCIVDGLFAKGFYEYGHQVDRETITAIANELLYFPNHTRLFSTTGCKHVMEKIDLIMQEDA